MYHCEACDLLNYLKTVVLNTDISLVSYPELIKLTIYRWPGFVIMNQKNSKFKTPDSTKMDIFQAP